MARPPAEVAAVTRCRSAVLDGEVCCVEPDGRPDFDALMFRRRQPCFYAFDLLMVNGRDLRGLPLLERKRRLRAILPATARVLYLDHITQRGCDLIRVACERELEGIVAKWTEGTYQMDGRWLKIKNPSYSQMMGRRELLEARRDRCATRRRTGASIGLERTYEH